MTMYFVIGGVFIAIGFLVKVFPDSIAGYNTMSAEKKKNVDIDGLSSMMRNCLVLMGVLVATGLPLFKLFQWKVNPAFFMLAVILSVTTIMLVFAQKYDHNKQQWYKKAFPFIIVVATFAFVGTMMFEENEPIKISISEKQITISGSYGLTTAVDQIELLESIPKIKLRTNGYSDGIVRKGSFLLEKWGSCTLFLQSDTKPFIKVVASGKTIIVNNEKPNDTRKLYEQLLAEMKN